MVISTITAEQKDPKRELAGRCQTPGSRSHSFLSGYSRTVRTTGSVEGHEAITRKARKRAAARGRRSHG